MFGKDWRGRAENKQFKRLLVVWVALPAILAPFWNFPALLKVLLLMGFNTIVIPLVIVIVLVLVNRADVMGEHTASRPRNLVLVAALALSVWLTLEKLPDYFQMIVG